MKAAADDRTAPRRGLPSVAVAVPVYRPALTPEERISWRHLLHYLGELDVRLLLPEGLASPLPDVRQVRFPASCFENVDTYSRLLLSEAFYRRFADREFLLVYQLDALVLSGDLERWCAASYDYLGAPWWRDPLRPELGLARTGNGGLSLRRIEAFLRVLTSRRRPPWRSLLTAPPPDLVDLGASERRRRHARILREARRGAGWYAASYSLNEDHFWSDRAPLFDPAFRIGPPREALGFAFEVAPRHCLELNGGRLPFGCHGWWRYDRAFWEPHLLGENDPAARRTVALRSGEATARPSLPAPPPGRAGWPWDAPATTAPAGDWPRLSIVVPSFQQGAYLEETLRSILLQGYPELELLVIDGGSRDGSVELLRRYDAFIDHWASEPDDGQSDAINKGFRRATGDLLTFFSSDDVYLPGAFFDAAEHWRRNPGCGAVVGAFRFLDEASRPVSAAVAPRLPGTAPADLALAAPGDWRLHQVATFYDRRALDSVGRRVRPELRYTMDRELLYRVCRTYPVVTSQRTYAGFRRHPESKSVSVVLPFCREMASLHRLDEPPGEPRRQRRRRRRHERHWLARGHLKLAAVRGASLAAAGSLTAALAYRPGLLAERGYWIRWAEAAGLAEKLRRLRGRPVPAGAGEEGGDE